MQKFQKMNLKKNNNQLPELFIQFKTKIFLFNIKYFNNLFPNSNKEISIDKNILIHHQYLPYSDWFNCKPIKYVIIFNIFIEIPLKDLFD